MRNLAETVQRIRQVKQARGKFLGLWAAECIFEQKKPLRRALADVLRCQYAPRIRRNDER